MTNCPSRFTLASEEGPDPGALQHGLGDEHRFHPVVPRLDQSFELSW